MQSDYFRYCALQALGGIYADVDAHCIAPLSSLLEAECSAQIFHSPLVLNLRGVPIRTMVNSLVAAREPAHPMLELSLEVATANIEGRISEDVPNKQPGRRVWFATGPGIFTNMLAAVQVGSLEALSQLGMRDNAPQPFIASFCDVISDYERLVRALDGVRVSALADCELLREPESELAHKAESSYWLNHEENIYRAADAPATGAAVRSPQQRP